jgi:monoamine oxidase
MDTDLAIVGAGAAGITAARMAQVLGLSCVVLEAGQRIGGRVFTDQSLGIPFDAGAAYIHFSNRNPWMREARRLGIETRFWRGFTHFQMIANGTPLGMASGERRSRAFDAFWTHLDALEQAQGEAVFDPLSMADGAASLTDEGQAALGDMARLGLGDEPEKVSLADYLEQWHGPDHVVPQGYGTLVSAAGRGLPVHLAARVQRVEAVKSGFQLATDKGTVRARAVIVTVSVGVLQAGHITFRPGLPPLLIKALDGLSMGALTKVALTFDGARFGIGVGEDKIVMDAPHGSMTFEMWPYDRNLVLAVTGGEAGRALIRLGEAGAVQEVLRIFCDFAGQEARRHFIAGRLANWWGDPLFEGGYATVRPGAVEARRQLNESGVEGLYFAGEASCGGRFGASMTVAGASYAGWDAVKRAAKFLKKGGGR